MQTNNKLRDALLMVKRLFDGRIMFQTAIREAHKAVDAALAEPVRNSEVGTAEEQVVRFRDFCGRYDADCSGCPCNDAACVSCSDCFARWEQLPYEKGESNDDK